MRGVEALVPTKSSVHVFSTLVEVWQEKRVKLTAMRLGIGKMTHHMHDVLVWIAIK